MEQRQGGEHAAVAEPLGEGEGEHPRHRDLVGAKVDPIYAAPRPGDVKDSQADIAKARRILNYEPKVSFEEGLARTVEWYRTSHVTVAR